MNLGHLRDKTREQHEATEALLPLTSPELQRAQYGAILQCFFRVVATWEAWAETHAPEHLLALVAERRRTPLLEADLRYFSLQPLAPLRDPPLSAIDHLLETHAAASSAYEATFLGAMYVMEGSTLGGQYIARHVEERFGLAPGEGSAYFRGYGEHTGSMWQAFRERLGAIPEEYTELTVNAAQAMFAYVQEGLRCCSASETAAAPTRTTEPQTGETRLQQ